MFGKTPIGERKWTTIHIIDGFTDGATDTLSSKDVKAPKNEFKICKERIIKVDLVILVHSLRLVQFSKGRNLS